MKRAITKQQKENIVFDYGMVYINYGVAGERRLGPTNGGGSIKVTQEIRDIEYDGRRGKEKGMQVVDAVNALISTTIKSSLIEDMAVAMPYAEMKRDGQNKPNSLTVSSKSLGVVEDSSYLDNVTFFVKVTGGGYKRATLYNAMSEGEFSLSAAPKAGGDINLEIHAHWDPEEEDFDLVYIEDLDTMGVDEIAPTVITVPANSDTNFNVSNSLTATFDKDMRQGYINAGNIVLVKAAGGDPVAGTLTYSVGGKMVTFAPANILSANTNYLWMLSNLRDTAGNKLPTTIVNFKTL